MVSGTKSETLIEEPKTTIIHKSSNGTWLEIRKSTVTSPLTAKTTESIGKIDKTDIYHETVTTTEKTRPTTTEISSTLKEKTKEKLQSNEISSDQSTVIQVTFSEKGIKMTSQLHILKYEVLSFSIKIHRNSNFLFLIWCDALFWTEKALKYFVLMDLIGENQAFKFWNVELGCHFSLSHKKSLVKNQMPIIKTTEIFIKQAETKENLLQTTKPDTITTPVKHSEKIQSLSKKISKTTPSAELRRVIQVPTIANSKITASLQAKTPNIETLPLESTNLQVTFFWQKNKNDTPALHFKILNP